MNWGGGENIGGEWFYYYGDGWNDNSVDNEYQGIVEKAKVPWILIHGWDAGPDKWATFEGFLEGDAIPYATVDLRPDADPNVRARTLAQKIDLLREQYRYHGKINLVCHSQGGLDARAYLRNLGGKANDQVYSLTMIATPNHGTRGATLRNWYAILTRMTPLPDKKSTPWLTPGWVEQFNKGTPLMAGVNYYTVAGLLKYSPFSLKKDRFGSLVLPGGDDGVVPVRSVLIDGPNVEHLGTFPYGHNELVARREVYDAVKQKIDPAYAEELDSLAFGAVEDGEVLAGQSASRSVIVDEVNEVAFMVISSGPLDFTLQSPSGESIAPQSLDASVIYDSGNWLDLQAQAYVVQKPISGVWKINVTGGAEPDYFLLLVSAENTFVLDGATDEYFNPVGGKVRLGATLDANASITDMRVEITDPNGSREIVALYDDGLHDDDLPDDGLYGNAFSPSLEGDYTLVFSAKGAIGDREFSRADLESIFVSPQTVPAQ
jgi:pimeloyl-ACP methyl ester carboxylesterase